MRLHSIAVWLFTAAAAPLSVQAEHPKLIVSILVDQLRYDYLERFHDQFVEGGFRLFTDRGAFMTFARYNYCPTITAPGHASSFSGSPPAMHGIIANDWFDKRTRKMMYCCADPSVVGVGTTGSAGKMSPRNFIGSNFADVFRLHYQTKVVGISMKDRGAILPAGKKPTGAYWFEASSGNFITSTYYTTDLPAWVKDFNARKRPADFLGQTWDLLLDPSKYERPDKLPGEGNLPDEKTPTFPHVVARPKPQPVTSTPTTVEQDVAPGAPTAAPTTSADLKAASRAASAAASSVAPAVVATPAADATTTLTPAPGTGTSGKPAVATKISYDNILPTPYSNELLAELAKAAIEGEHLGQGAGPDLLTVSFSAVDACGHRFGPYSREVQDITLRLDRQLADLFAYLDQKVGLNNVILTLTADHGVMPTPEFAVTEGLDGQRADEVALLGDLLPKLSERFGTASVLLTKRIFEGNLYFNHDALRERNIAPSEVASFIRDWALNTGKFHACYSREQLLDGRAPGPIGERVLNGFNAERSGDVVLVYKPYTISWGGKTGTTHGSPYSYDTHIPVAFYGAPFKPGHYADEFYITDLVPTLCAVLGLNHPAMSIGKPFTKAITKP